MQLAPKPVQKNVDFSAVVSQALGQSQRQHSVNRIPEVPEPRNASPPKEARKGSRLPICFVVVLVVKIWAGTGFVLAADLPMSDDEDEGEATNPNPSAVKSGRPSL